MPADLISPMEARLLALERRVIGVDRSLRMMRQAVVTLNQDVWAAWSDVSVVPTPQPAPPSAVTAFSNICSSIPLILPLHDNFYGDTTLTWDGSSSWKGCKVVSYPGSSLCAKASTAIFYSLIGDNTTNIWGFQISWVGTSNFPGACPKNGATCKDVPNQSSTDYAEFHCHGASIWGRASGNIYPPGLPAQTITIP